MTKSFDEPSLDLYNNLLQKYGNELKCSCLFIASIHDRFIQVKPTFHEVCSTSFSSDEWRIALTANLSNLSLYEQRDYRRFISAHLQYLNGLCYLSIKSVNNSIDQFLSSSFISEQLLSEVDFNYSITSLIEQSKSNAPTIFNSLLFLIRSINHGNKIISTYGTNFEYIAPWFVFECADVYLPTQGIIYDNECSCGLYPNCTTQANFIGKNSSETTPIKGLKIGCTPSESFLASTLECFYDTACINLIQNYTNYNDSFIPLSKKMNRYAMNTTIAELVDNLFVDQWSTQTNYSSYFEQCAPLSCSYTYIQKFNLFYTVTLLLGLQGGLAIVLKWICPKIIQFIFMIYQYRKRRMNIVQPVYSLETTTVDELEPSTTTQTNTVSPVQCSFRIILMFISLMLLITGLILFSIYTTRQKADPVAVVTMTSTASSTSTYMNATAMSTSSTTTMPVCKLQFQPISIVRPYSGISSFESLFVGDFNNDSLLDLNVFSASRNTMYTLSGYGNGTFGNIFESLMLPGYYLSNAIVDDFNCDNQFDIAVIIFHTSSIGVLLGRAGGTFGEITIYRVEPGNVLTDIVTADFNGDNYLDIAVASKSNDRIGVLLGNELGTFAFQGMLYTEKESYPVRLAINDFNGDHHLDIAVVNSYERNIGVFLGRGDGTFAEQRTSFTGGGLDPEYITVSDFNGDTRQDVVVSYNGKRIGVMFGYGNGTFGGKIKFTLEFACEECPLALAAMDFDKNGHMDIVIGHNGPYSVSILFGDGNGNFWIQTIFSTELDGDSTILTIGDFNSDDYQDIVVADRNSGSVDLLLNMGVCSITDIV